MLLIGELMKQAERYLAEGTHPRVIVEVRRGVVLPVPDQKREPLHPSSHPQL